MILTIFELEKSRICYDNCSMMSGITRGFTLVLAYFIACLLICSRTELHCNRREEKIDSVAHTAEIDSMATHFGREVNRGTFPSDSAQQIVPSYRVHSELNSSNSLKKKHVII